MAAQVKNIEVSNDCKTISFVGTNSSFAGTDTATITTSNNEDSITVSAGDIALNTNTLSFTKISSAALVGVIKVQILNSGLSVVEEFLSIASCQIDCCIAKLVESAITCDCHCDKCKEDLDRAEKIHLLLQAAKYAAEQEGNYDDAVDKYKRAQEMCTEVCACGC